MHARDGMVRDDDVALGWTPADNDRGRECIHFAEILRLAQEPDAGHRRRLWLQGKVACSSAYHRAEPPFRIM